MQTARIESSRGKHTAQCQYKKSILIQITRSAAHAERDSDPAPASLLSLHVLTSTPDPARSVRVVCARSLIPACQQRECKLYVDADIWTGFKY